MGIRKDEKFYIVCIAVRVLGFVEALWYVFYRLANGSEFTDLLMIYFAVMMCLIYFFCYNKFLKYSK